MGKLYSYNIIFECVTRARKTDFDNTTVLIINSDILDGPICKSFRMHSKRTSHTIMKRKRKQKSETEAIYGFSYDTIRSTRNASDLRLTRTFYDIPNPTFHHHHRPMHTIPWPPSFHPLPTFLFLIPPDPLL